jgi:glyoxylase-like metal-dependent hydrolase (beta-lactamase superfamily II)
MGESVTWDLYVMEYARSKDQPWVDLISGTYREGVMDLPFSFIFAQKGEDHVLIDTGFMQDAHGSAFSQKFGIPTWISPLRMLAEIGVHADAINAIFVTHAHFDHMGSIAEFPNAHIYIQKSELLSWYEAFALPKRFGHLTAVVNPDNIRTALEASIAHRVTLIDGDKDDVLPGIHVRLASGHR